MAGTPRDQPSNVATEDVIKPRDEHVTTSDTPPEVVESRDPKPKGDTAAGDDKKPGSNDQNSEAGDKKFTPKQRRKGDPRFHKLSDRLSKAEKANQELATRNATLENEVNALKAATPKAPEPQLKDFENPQEYAKAYSKWEKDAEAAAKPVSPPPPPPPPAADPPPPETDPDIEAFRKAGQEKLGDQFVEALNDDDNAVNAVMGEFMLDSDVGPELYVHLSNNQDEARKIFDSKPRQAVKALEALEAKAAKGELDVEGELQIEDPNPEPDPKPTEKKGRRPGGTKAPEPPTDTKPGTATIDKDPEDEDMEEYAARRQREERAAKGLPPI